MCGDWVFVDRCEVLVTYCACCEFMIAYRGLVGLKNPGSGLTDRVNTSVSSKAGPEILGPALIPREVETLSGRRTIMIACGVWHSASVVSVSGEATSSGKLFVWGDGEDEKLGHDDNKESRLIPSCCNGVLDPSHHNVVRAPSCIEGGLGKSFVQKVACGFHHIAVLNSKAEVYTWGRGSNGQLGHGDTKYRRMPTLVRALKGHPFNCMRKLHNCYNCGSVSCASKKSLAAAMAPKTNRPYRVYDDCYIKLEGAREYLETPASSARFSNARLSSSINEMDAIGTTPQRQLLRVDSFDFFR
ncbi:BnaC01g42780D [Brassica napus]|uniref:BnaC01g42780D protein n=2 Tax=Brassica TaxID=3705 RepID=A0A078IWQ1_BRANA|nr:BnaC01g42780D [Brassica napus]